MILYDAVTVAAFAIIAGMLLMLITLAVAEAAYRLAARYLAVLVIVLAIALACYQVQRACCAVSPQCCWGPYAPRL